MITATNTASQHSSSRDLSMAAERLGGVVSSQIVRALEEVADVDVSFAAYCSDAFATASRCFRLA